MVKLAGNRYNLLLLKEKERWVYDGEKKKDFKRMEKSWKQIPNYSSTRHLQ